MNESVSHVVKKLMNRIHMQLTRTPRPPSARLARGKHNAKIVRGGELVDAHSGWFEFLLVEGVRT